VTSGRWRLDPNDIKALALAPLLPAGVLVLFDAASRVLAFGPLAIVGALLFGFYLAIVMDLFSRKIVGWATRATIHRQLVLDAVLMAVKRRRPRGTVIHSDQSSQYSSDDWRRFCRTNRLEPSMSRRGNCWDNAVAESFFRSLTVN